MDKKSILKKVSTFIVTICVLILIVIVYKMSDLLLSNSLDDYFKVDKTTSNYISFNYAGVDVNSVYKIDKPKVYSDFKGKKFVNNYYDFELDNVEENNKINLYDFDIILKDMGNEIDNRYIKVYLTDQNNNPLGGYDKQVPLYSAFLNDIDGKIIYSGKIDNLNKKFRLRIWISDMYEKKVNNNLAFQITVKVK